MIGFSQSIRKVCPTLEYFCLECFQLPILQWCEFGNKKDYYITEIKVTIFGALVIWVALLILIQILIDIYIFLCIIYTGINWKQWFWMIAKHAKSKS